MVNVRVAAQLVVSYPNSPDQRKAVGTTSKGPFRPLVKGQPNKDFGGESKLVSTRLV